MSVGGGLKTPWERLASALAMAQLDKDVRNMAEMIERLGDGIPFFIDKGVYKFQSRKSKAGFSLDHRCGGWGSSWNSYWPKLKLDLLDFSVGRWRKMTVDWPRVTGKVQREIR